MEDAKNCRVCGKLFTRPPRLSFKSWTEVRVTCSKQCGATNRNYKGTYEPLAKVCANPDCRITFVKKKRDTHKHFATQRFCSISCSKMGISKGSLNNNWRGDDVGYQGVHIWMRKTYGQPEFCEHCKTSEHRMYHWANISREYKRERSDWLRLCVPCHHRYDKS